MQTIQINDLTQANFKTINMTTQETTSVKSKMTYFGQASSVFTYYLLNKVIDAVNTSDAKYDYIRVPFHNYHEVFAIKIGAEDDAPVKKYHVHKLIYGPTKTVKGKEDFHLRTDEEDFWGKQWGFEYSPFRMVQKVLKDHGLYLVDHTFSGETPYFYVYKHLPSRDVIDKKPWHDYCNIPALCSKDFTSKKLSHEDAISAASLAYDKFSALCVKESIDVSGILYMVEEDTTPILHKKKIITKAKHILETVPIEKSDGTSSENLVIESTNKKTYAQILAGSNV